MRLDKYLKVSRIIKRRPVAKEVADKGRIKVNSILAKSSTDLKVGDEIEIRFGNKLFTVQNIYIEVVCIVRKVSAKYANKVRYSLVVGFTKRLGYYGEGI